MIVLGVRARPQATPHVDEVHGPEMLVKLWGRADFIMCCVPLLDSTRGLIGEQAFASMKPSAVLIDVSRGGVVDETSLLAALEPLPPNHPLWSYENVVITPHWSSVYDGWEEKSARMFADNLAHYRRGEPLENVVRPERGY